VHLLEEFEKKTTALVPSNMVKGTFRENIQKNRQISRKTVLKSSRFFGGFGRIFSFLLLKFAIFS
jgi:hypothetical protein